MIWQGSFLMHNGRTIGEACQLSAGEWLGRLYGMPYRTFRTRTAGRRAVAVAAKKAT